MHPIVLIPKCSELPRPDLLTNGSFLPIGPIRVFPSVLLLLYSWTLHLSDTPRTIRLTDALMAPKVLSVKERRFRCPPIFVNRGRLVARFEEYGPLAQVLFPTEVVKRHLPSSRGGVPPDNSVPKWDVHPHLPPLGNAKLCFLIQSFSACKCSYPHTKFDARHLQRIFFCRISIK